MDIPNFNGCIIFFGLGYPNLFYYHLVDGLSVSSFAATSDADREILAHMPYMLIFLFL